jgi:hypothetical protein
MEKSAQSPRPSPSSPDPTFVRDALHYHGRLLLLAACCHASLCTRDLLILGTELVALADRLPADRAGKERP